MAIERPTIEQLQALASRLNIRLTPAQAEEYLALMQANFDAYDLIDALPDEIPAVHYPRAAGYRPEGDENPLNAWYYKTEVTGAATGKLAGRTVVLKDNIALAGVPMMNGASTLEGFVPLYDATVATRLLDAGATILGKATCEHFCFNVEDVDAAVRELRAAGVDSFLTEEPYSRDIFGGVRIIFLTGPSGELIELFQDHL